MKKIFLSLLLVCLFVNSYAQREERSVKLYQNTRDFIKDSAWDIDANTVITEESEDHIQLKNIIDATTRKNIKRGISTWAIEYKGQKYFNLGYSEDLNRWGVFIKFDIIGRYSAIIIDDEIPINVKNDSKNYGGGLNGALIKESNKWGKSWKTENGEKKKILFMDTHELDRISYFSQNAQCATANYLTKGKLKEIMGDQLPQIDLENVTLEKVIEIINSLNETLKF